MPLVAAVQPGQTLMPGLGRGPRPVLPPLRRPRRRRRRVQAPLHTLRRSPAVPPLAGEPGVVGEGVARRKPEPPRPNAMPWPGVPGRRSAARLRALGEAWVPARPLPPPVSRTRRRTALRAPAPPRMRRSLSAAVVVAEAGAGPPLRSSGRSAALPAAPSRRTCREWSTGVRSPEALQLVSRPLPGFARAVYPKPAPAVEDISSRPGTQPRGPWSG